MTNLVGTKVEFDTVGHPKTKAWAGVVWLVERKLQVNIEMRRIDADGKPYGTVMRTHPSMVRPVGTVPAPVFHAPLTMGAIVRVTGIEKIHPSTLFIVMKDNGGTVKLVKLGGDGGRYWPSVPRTMITVVDVNDVLK